MKLFGSRQKFLLRSKLDGKMLVEVARCLKLDHAQAEYVNSGHFVKSCAIAVHIGFVRQFHAL